MFSPAGREKTQNQCISIIVWAQILKVLRVWAGVDIHIAGAGGNVTHTLRVWAVMVRNSAGAGGSEMKKTVPQGSTLHPLLSSIHVRPKPYTLLAHSLSHMLIIQLLCHLVVLMCS